MKVFFKLITDYCKEKKDCLINDYPFKKFDCNFNNALDSSWFETIFFLSEYVFPSRHCNPEMIEKICIGRCILDIENGNGDYDLLALKKLESLVSIINNIRRAFNNYSNILEKQ